MSGDDDARHGAMVEFLGSFPTLSGSPPGDLTELGDGVALFEALSEIAPDYFDPTTIARHLGDNWALKSSNLRKLLRNLEHFFHESLGKDADFEAQTENVGAIARSSDRAAIAELVELVAAAAVTCENRGEFVGRIMGMTPENQIQMKAVIESSLSRLSDYDADGDGEEEDVEENELVFGQDAAPAENQGTSDDSALFSPTRSTTSDDRGELERALMDARRELAAHKSQASLVAEDNENAQRKLKALVGDLQNRLEKRQKELSTVEADYKATSMELDDSKARVEDLENRIAQLADDLDVANAKAEQLRKAEATVVAYRRKLEGVGVMSQQMNDLEDQAASYLSKIMELESDVKKIPNLQRTIDDLQSQVSGMEKERDDAGSAMKGSASEIAELRSKLTAAENAKRMYEEELEELRAQQGVSTDEELNTPMPELGSESASETREKVMRLEIEKKTLQEKVAKLQTAASENAKAAGDSAEAGNLGQEVKTLKEELAKKEAEKAKIAGDKDKLEAYTKRTLAKFQEKYLVALQECKAKLKEKQDKIEALESRSASEKTAQKREERLLSSTIYELGLAIMQNRLKER
mmetsp:Transcript_18121/g.41925  ORF Transcript_18121/g.41925 Transcript_18121/m.41925 type:complete len:583 (+) Transcript_18121:171-1919(+)